ncbi:MAG: gallate dioxygenase [Nevskiaceae bacterium]|jgi:gallate dioxygenase|nr:gallate dioxygenase [Nevskiaceae bacterium]
MARIIGGVATSHTPTIGFAIDAQKQNDPVWAPIFEGYKPVQKWLAENKPDVLVYIFNDHITSFFFDHYSHFALGVGDKYAPADEGGGPRALPAVAGHPKFAAHIARAMVAQEFDLSYFQNKNLDHGFFSPMSLLMPPNEAGWPAAIVPIQCGVLDLPIPSPKRFFKFGQALRKAIESYPEDLKVVVLGTGGLSHQVHGERCGFNNTPWDMEFLERLEKDPEGLTEVTIAEYAALGGWEGAEVVMWLMMRGALSKKVKKLHQTYYLPSMTPICSVIFENDSDDPVTETVEQFRQRMNHQTDGAEKLEGTYPFTIERSVQAFRINNFLHELIKPEFREQFLTDPEPLFVRYELSNEERDLIRRRDWRGMIHYGVIFFLLEKLGAVLGTTNLHIYAAMRGQSLEDFLKTRNAQVLYSVAGNDDSKKSWDKAAVK